MNEDETPTPPAEVRLTLRLPRALYEKLVQLAAQEDRSVNMQVAYLLKQSRPIKALAE